MTAIRPFPWRAMPAALGTVLFLLCRQGCELRLPQGKTCWICRALPAAEEGAKGGLLLSLRMEDTALRCRLHGVDAAAGVLLDGVDLRRLPAPLRTAATQAWCAQLLDAVHRLSGVECRLDSVEQWNSVASWNNTEGADRQEQPDAAHERAKDAIEGAFPQEHDHTVAQLTQKAGLHFQLQREDGVRLRGCVYGVPMPLVRALLAMPPRPAPRAMALLPQGQPFVCALPVRADICRLSLAQCRRAAPQDVLLFPAGEGIAVTVGTVARARLDAAYFLHVEECMPRPEETLPDAGALPDDFPEDRTAPTSWTEDEADSPAPAQAAAAKKDAADTAANAEAERGEGSPSVPLESCMLEVQCDLGSISLCLAELADLRAGAVLGPLRSTAAPVLLRTGGTVIGAGALVDMEGRAGVQITEWRLARDES